MIVCAHFGYQPLAAAHAPGFVFQVLDARSLFTSTFFVLSGFLLTLSLRGRNVSARQFLTRRVLRLAPVHWVCFLAMLPAVAPGRSTARIAADAAAWLTMSHGLVNAGWFDYNAPAWAVSSFLLGYVLILPLSRTEPTTKARLLFALAAVWTGVLAPQAILAAAAGGQFTYPGPATGLQTLAHTFPLFRVGEVAFGAALALLCREHTLPRFVRSDRAVLGLLAIFALAIAAPGSNPPLRYLITHGLLLPALGLLIVSLWSNRGRVERALDCPLLQRGGRASLLIYFVHYPAFTMARTGANLPLFLATLCAVVAGCCLLQPWYDRCCERLESACGSPQPRLLKPVSSDVT